MQGPTTIGVNPDGCASGCQCVKLRADMVRFAVINGESGQGQYHCNIPVQQSQCGNRRIGRARLEAAVDNVIMQLFGAEPLR